MTVKELRTKTRLSQSRFSARYGIPVRTLQQWEQNISSPPEYVTRLLEDKILSEKNVQCNDYISQYRLKAQPKWGICIDEPFKNCDKIHPLQQRKIKLLIDEISMDKRVGKIVVFGSSVTNQCHIGSDVDIYVQSSEDINPIKRAYEFDIDFWNNFRVDKRLMAEIDKKGVTVYG